MTFRELKTDEEIEAAFPVMAELRDRIRRATFLVEVRRQQDDGYRLAGGFDDGALVVLAGFRHGHTLSRGPHLFVDDLVTTATARGQGRGRACLEWLAELAASEGLDEIYLDSRDTAVGFYGRLGFAPLTSVPVRVPVARLRRAPRVEPTTGGAS